MSVLLDELAYFVSRYPVAATDVAARQLKAGDLMGSVAIVNRSHLGVASGLPLKVFQEGLEQVFDGHNIQVSEVRQNMRWALQGLPTTSRRGPGLHRSGRGGR